MNRRVVVDLGTVGVALLAIVLPWGTLHYHSETIFAESDTGSFGGLGTEVPLDYFTIGVIVVTLVFVVGAVAINSTRWRLVLRGGCAFLLTLDALLMFAFLHLYRTDDVDLGSTSANLEPGYFLLLTVVVLLAVGIVVDYATSRGSTGSDPAGRDFDGGDTDGGESV